MYRTKQSPSYAICVSLTDFSVNLRYSFCYPIVSNLVPAEIEDVLDKQTRPELILNMATRLSQT